ncbi:hypothetical protein FHS27_004123 [Rhodopirellula rubra]|uniref:Uncharacterized protein n=1 Tax=Aporhodopirellula rubra TaxID=980271 RepID=A0A7W5E192_9BACT|nr:hypothetical protein [Aporhodopirellula rubra]MBB3208295.1 hypothetical protein [Aporhodopirellula rubra]
MTAPEDEFRPQTLPEQIRGILIRSGFQRNRRLWVAILGWMLTGLLLASLVYLWFYANSAGWVPSTLMVGRTSMLISLLTYMLQRGFTLVGMVHIVLWYLWRSPQPSLKHFLIGSILISVYCSTMQYQPLLTTIDHNLWIRAFANYLLTIAWFLMLFRAMSAWGRFELTPIGGGPPTSSSFRGWTLGGMLLAATLVAITIVIKRWINNYFIDTDPFSTAGYSIWINLASETGDLLNTLVLVYAAAAIAARRHAAIPMALIIGSAIIRWVISQITAELLPTFYARPELSDYLLSISVGISTTLVMQWVAFSVWTWAGYKLRVVPKHDLSPTALR